MRWDKRSQALDHLWHVWINERQDERRRTGETWEHDLYGFKEMLNELERLPFWLKAANEGTLPTVHQQCSRSEPEPIKENRLTCAMGQNVAECPILTSFYASWQARRDTYYAQVTEDDDRYVVGARICCWHIYANEVRSGHGSMMDGYVEDGGDRMFWDRVAESLSYEDHP